MAKQVYALKSLNCSFQFLCVENHELCRSYYSTVCYRAFIVTESVKKHIISDEYQRGSFPHCPQSFYPPLTQAKWAFPMMWWILCLCLCVQEREEKKDERVLCMQIDEKFVFNY